MMIGFSPPSRGQKTSRDGSGGATHRGGAVLYLGFQDGSQSLGVAGVGAAGETLVDHGHNLHQSLSSGGFAWNHGSQRFNLNAGGPSVTDDPLEGSGVVSGEHSDFAVSSGIGQLSVGNQISPEPEVLVLGEDSLEDQGLHNQLRGQARGGLTSSGSGESLAFPFVLVGDSLNVGEVGVGQSVTTVEGEVPFQDGIGIVSDVLSRSKGNKAE